MTQAAFAARAGVCPRTLRLWLSRHRAPSPTGKSTRNVVLRAAAALRDAAERLEAAVAGVELTVAANGTADDRVGGAEPLLDSLVRVSSASNDGEGETHPGDDSYRPKKFTFD